MGRAMGKIIAVVNQKGGVGKTTTAINTAAFIAEQGFSVLVVDVDPQGNASLSFGIDKKSEDKTVYDLLTGNASAREVIKMTKVEGLSIIPSNVDLAAVEVEFSELENKESRLREGLLQVKSSFDYIFIDVPPSLSVITLNALTAADSVLIPMQPEFFALDGLANLLETIKRVKEVLNHKLHIEGVVITMFDGRTVLSQQVVKEVKEKFADRVYETLIPRNVRLSESPSFGMPINLYDKHSKGAIAYRALAEEITGTKVKKEKKGAS
jgi:chromosome partitioning protein